MEPEQTARKKTYRSMTLKGILIGIALLAVGAALRVAVPAKGGNREVFTWGSYLVVSGLAVIALGVFVYAWLYVLD